MRMRMKTQIKCCALLLVICFSFAEEQNTPKIHSLHIRSDITYRFSTTLVTSKVANPDTVSREAKFDVTLPNEAFITKFKLMINNETYDGEVKEKEEAKKQYEEAKAKGQSAGHIVAKPRETNKFQIMVNIAAEGHVTFELTYQELLRRKKGLYSHVTYIDPRQLVDDLLIEVAINESRDLSLLQVPAIRNDTLTNNDNEDENELAVIERPSPKSAIITFRPTVNQQRQESEKGIRGQFVVEYDIERENVAGELLVVDGYFVHYFTPDELPPLPMDIIYILDTSGSMSGRKMQQLKEAMKKILSDMRTDDRFTLMTFDRSIRFWKDMLVSLTDQTLLEAKDFVDKIRAGGLTNINDALERGIDLLSSIPESSRAPVIIFLTDGEPTAGETNPTQILSNVRSKNEIEIPIFSLAFGRGADYQFTKKLAAQNNGLGRKIYEDSDSSLQITGFIEEVSTVLLKNVTFKYLNDKVNETTLTKTKFNTVFGGSELIISGRLSDQTSQSLTTNKLPLSITGTGRNEPFICIYPLPPIQIDEDNNDTNNVSRIGYFSTMTEKLWAYLTIKQWLRKLDALTDEDEKQRLNEKILQMSLKYEFVTPLTSMVVTMPDELKATPRLVEDDVSSNNNFASSQMSMSSPFLRSGILPAGLMSMPSVPIGSQPGLPGSMGLIGYAPRPLPLRTFNHRPPVVRTTTSNPTITTTVRQTTTVTTTTTAAAATTTQKPPAPVGQLSSTGKIKFVSIFIRIPGIISPLCMNLPPGNFTLMKSLKEGETILVEAGPSTRRESPVVRVTHTNRTARLDIFPKPGLGNATSLGQIRSNNINMDVIQIEENSSIRLQLYIQPQLPSADMDGILGAFRGMKGRRIWTGKTRNGNRIAKLKLRKGSQKIRARAVEAKMKAFVPMWFCRCWVLDKKLMNKLNLDLLKFKI